MKYFFLAALILGAVIAGFTNLAVGDETDPPPVVSSDGNKIISFDIVNETPNLPVMTFFVRYPKGIDPKGQVDGVFQYVTCLTKKDNLAAWISRSSDQDMIFHFADLHHLALVTWTTDTMYSISDSFTTESSEESEPSNPMEQSFRTWKRAMNRLSHDYSFPSNGYLIYGSSRGGQWAHRIVLRAPDKFLAVHIHINSSFQEPTPEASHCLWLLTTGELEHGMAAAKIFYQKALALNYPIMLRIYPGKGHEDFPEEQQLDVAFFEYVLKLRDEENKLTAGRLDAPSSFADASPFVLDDSLMADFQKPHFYGDMLNGDVYSAAHADLVPDSQRVGIPDLGIAKLWGYFHP